MTNLGTNFEGYSYRTSSRFGSRVSVSIEGENVSITGPRTSVFFYRLWIAAQVVLFWLIVPVVVAAVLLGNWWYLALVPGLLIVHWVVSSFGAGCLWELANLAAFAEGRMGETHSFPLSAVKRVNVGRDWARKGLWLVILPYIPGINQLAGEYVVSFEAPDGETGRDAVYAFHMRTTEKARALAQLVDGG